MTKKEFIRKMNRAMKECNKGQEGQEFTCNILKEIDDRLEYDYVQVYGNQYDKLSEEFYWIPVNFGLPEGTTTEHKTEVRLTALSMYMAQSLEFGYYKDL